MLPRQIASIIRLAAWFALGPYAAGVLLFALFASSDFADDRRPPNLATYIVLYFVYLALYVAIATVLARPGTVWERVGYAFCGAVLVGVIGSVAFTAGFALGFVLLFTLGLLLGLGLVVPFAAVPVMGVAVGEIISRLMVRLTQWPKPVVFAEIRARQIVSALIAACLAMWFGLKYAVGAGASYGYELVGLHLLAGLAGPLLHAAIMSLPAAKKGSGALEPLAPQARGALGAIMLMTAVVLGGAVALTHSASGRQLWTTKGLADVTASREDIEARRQPPADQPVRIGRYILDRKPAELPEGFYDWKSRRYLNAMFSIGDAGAPDTVRVRLQVLHGETGLGYICEPTPDSELAPCNVIKRNDPVPAGARVMRVSLYNGESQIGRVAGREFMISCRYSGQMCVAEFTEPWFDNLKVTLQFSPADMSRWRDVLPRAIGEIERLVRPVS
jgi:hypothetical protein